MIPLKLSLSGFLSYRDLVDLDFTNFDLACISGPNGAGKSSLLDAITWVLFGQARRRDDALINTRSDTASVELIFTYEGNLYRIQRSKPRGKTTLLEFHIAQTDEQYSAQTPKGSLGAVTWKPLTERTMRETQARIESTLRLDYETFVNAAFFLQGKADQFTQQRPGDRKRILANILGLEIWETYRQRAVTQRKAIEAEILELEGRLQEIDAEMSEEGDRKQHLKELESQLALLSKDRAAQEAALEDIRRTVAILEEQARLVEALARQLAAARERVDELELKLGDRQKERDAYAQTLNRAQEIETRYHAWQQARDELQHWDEVAAQYHEAQQRRQKPLTGIEAERARLTQEQQTLLAQQIEIASLREKLPQLETEIEQAKKEQERVQAQLRQRIDLEKELNAAQEKLANAQAENPRLKAEMEELKARIDRLAEVEGAACPVCGKPLQPDERQHLIKELEAKGKSLGDRYRANKALLDETKERVSQLQTQISELQSLDEQLRALTRTCDQLDHQRRQIEERIEKWERDGAARLKEVEQALEEERFALQARAALAEIDAELKELGYDAAAHDAVRRAEQEGWQTEGEMRQLERAREALKPLEREIADLTRQVETQREEVRRREKEHEEAVAKLAAAQAQAPDIDRAERTLLEFQERENSLRMEVGAARQKVVVLAELKVRRQKLEKDREELALRVGQYQQLERAFGKDGVPALLIEQALPQIEAKANEILERLSGGELAVRFLTQREYKDKRRQDLRETLDILISDRNGVRDYELYSGGEAFRVNFAVRLALSEVLAARAGARLQTLVIDEGFGSQDAMGRQRLVEAINTIKGDFAKILVITHIDELKDAFPTRIEVEKGPTGSRFQVV